MDLSQMKAKLSRRPHSPLFARIASQECATGNLDEALELLASGLRMYPMYGAGHLVKAKCHERKGDYRSALVHLKYALKTLPNSDILLRLQPEWSEKAIIQSVSQAISDFPEKVSVVENVIPAVPIAEMVPHVVPEPVYHAPSPIEETSMSPILDSSLSHDTEHEPSGESWDEGVEEAPIDQVQSSAADFQDVRPATAQKFSASGVIAEGRIVSKTLAEIYAKQGEFGEAILTYRLLKQQRPSLSEEFEQRIRELELKLEVKPN